MDDIDAEHDLHVCFGWVPGEQVGWVRHLELRLGLRTAGPAYDYDSADRLPWMERVPISYGPYNEPREGSYYSFPLLIPESAPLGTHKLYLGLADRASGELVSLASTELEIVSSGLD
ncbi:MAG TPA: hypothetical protein VM163_12810 [bacterium]|nr:hypothetical protein [bacterium]